MEAKIKTLASIFNESSKLIESKSVNEAGRSACSLSQILKDLQRKSIFAKYASSLEKVGITNQKELDFRNVRSLLANQQFAVDGEGQKTNFFSLLTKSKNTKAVEVEVEGVKRTVNVPVLNEKGEETFSYHFKTVKEWSYRRVINLLAQAKVIREAIAAGETIEVEVKVVKAKKASKKASK